MADTSPCVSICILDEDDEGNEFCIGCYRTVDEIATWQSLPVEEQIRLTEEVKLRTG